MKTDFHNEDFALSLALKWRVRSTRKWPIAPWPCARDFSRALSKLRVNARNPDWFIAVFALVVIGRSNYFGIGFSTIN